MTDENLSATMKIKYISLLFLMAISSLTASAQLKHFTLEDLIPGGKTFWSMQPSYLNTAWWGDKLIRLQATDCAILNGRHDWRTLFSQSDVNTAMRNAGIDESIKVSLTAATFPKAGQPEAVFVAPQALISYNWETHKISRFTRFTRPVSWQDYCPQTGNIAYNDENNLWITLAGDASGKNEALRLSTDGSRNLVYGQSVHRDEFGISKGTFWSPDGESLCFYRMDQSMVADYPLVDISTRIATLQPLKYPMAGETSHKVSMGVYNLRTQQTVWLNTGDNTDRYFACITWGPDSRKIYLYDLNRDQNHARLLQFDARTGQLDRVLLEETDPKYVEPQHPLAFLPWDSDKFVYWSQRDGYDNLYLFSLKENKTLRCITYGHKGNVVEFNGFDVKNKSLVVTTTWASPIQLNLYSIGVNGGKARLLDNGKGVHRGLLSPSGSLLVDTWSSPDVPRQTDYVRVDGGRPVTLLTSYSMWKGYDVPDISCGTLKAADGTTDLYYRLIKPTGFDPHKKYPAVVYVYGGPHTRLVQDSWGYDYRGWEIYMAQLGYVVFVLDNRGSSERGRVFEDVTFRHLGTEEMKDQMKGVEFLKSLPYVDGDRLGVHGWSFGGFMTTNLMLTYPDVFKCGVAGGPVINWKYYEVMYGERYMDTPQSNPDGYAGNDLTRRAGDLKGRLLIIFGYNDPVCVPQHTLSFIRACETAGTHPDLLTYPGDGHNMAGRDRIHLHEHITRYFEDHLKPLKTAANP
jgi:dipeptidyl-peptidase-4